jgi:serine/threonine-protein kinase
MPPQTAAELLDWLADKQLLDATQVAELRNSGADDARCLARALLQRDWLTPYQANQILQGKGEQLLLGPYYLRERLAEGAMGQVYKAWHPRLGRLVAVKTLHKELVSSPKARDRFLREVRLVAQLVHPNIVRSLDAGEVDGRLFLAMDFVEGTNLSALMKQNGPLPVEVAVDYARQVALGLQHAFERGIIHRDIKPSNLMVASGAATSIKILDFGLARFDTEEEEGKRLTQVGKLLGTVDYIAPEQAADARRADHRADIYSLGCTLYYLLTGQPAFPGTDLVEKIHSRQLGEPPDVRALCPEASVGLAEVLRKLMARRPEDRYQTAAEAAVALEPYTLRMPAPPPEPVAKAAPPRGIVLAQPVPADALPPAGTPIPLAVALPVTAAPPPSDAETFALDHTPAAPRPPRPRVPAAAPVPWRWLAGGGVLGLVLLLVLFLLFRGGGQPVAPKPGYWNPGAAVHIERVRLSVDAIHPGEIKRILVEIRRDEFDGPVTIKVDPDSLPPGFSATTPRPIPEKKKGGMGGEIMLTVGTDADVGRYELKIVAVAENLSDERMLTVPVEAWGRK